VLHVDELPEKPNFINEIIEEERTAGAALAWVGQFVRTVSNRPPPNLPDTVAKTKGPRAHSQLSLTVTVRP